MEVIIFDIAPHSWFVFRLQTLVEPRPDAAEILMIFEVVVDPPPVKIGKLELDV